jgi:hypothetical protein
VNRRRYAYGWMTKRCDILYSFRNFEKGGKTVKRILFISLAVVLGLSVGLIGCGGEELPPEGPDVIMVGSARDTDEGMADFECYHGGPFMRYWVNTVNAEDGGIYLSKYEETVPLELVEREASVASWDIGTVAQGLIDDGAVMIFGSWSTDTVYTLAPVCNKNAVILMSLEGGASKMVWEPEDSIDNWPYVWINLSFANWYEIPVLKGMLDDKVTGRDPIAYVTYIGGIFAEHGLEYSQTTFEEFGTGNILPAGGIETADFMTQEDANLVIQNAITALGDPNDPNYDIFCAYTYPWNVAAIFQAAQTYGFNPPAMIFGPGSSQGYYEVNNGAEAIEGILSFGTANYKTTVKVGTPTISMADLYDGIGAQIEDDWANYDPPCSNYYGATSGTELLDFWGEPIFEAGLEMWKAAVEEVGELDNTDIRDVMASFSSSNPCSTCFGDTWYRVFGNGLGGGILDYMCMTGQIGQWQSGIFEITGYDGINNNLPNYDATADFVFPMTDKWGWL